MSDHSYLRDAISKQIEIDATDSHRRGLRMKRDEAIWFAHHSEGKTVLEIREATGLTRAMIYRIINTK